MKLSNVLKETKKILSKSNINDPLKESKLIISHVLSTSLEIFILELEKEITFDQKDRIFQLIKRRAEKLASEDLKASSIVKKIIDETEESASFYPSIKKINDSHSKEEKIELLKVLWELVTADSVVDAYEENLYFKIAELIKIKRSIANQIRQQDT